MRQSRRGSASDSEQVEINWADQRCGEHCVLAACDDIREEETVCSRHTASAKFCGFFAVLGCDGALQIAKYEIERGDRYLQLLFWLPEFAGLGRSAHGVDHARIRR
jgi:hypothetical protein